MNRPTMTPAEVEAVCAKFEQMAAAEVPFAECMEAAIGAARAPLLALVAENARLREALRMMLRGTQEDCGRVCVPSDAAVRAAFAALAGAVHD